VSRSTAWSTRGIARARPWLAVLTALAGGCASAGAHGRAARGSLAEMTADEPSPPAAPAPQQTPAKVASEDPAAVVQAQLEAYNRRDLPGFLATFAADAEVFTLGDAAPAARGTAELAKLYGELFAASPALHSELVHRAVIGARVVDHERITGRRGSAAPLELVMVYEVEGGLIRRAWAIRP